MKIKRNINKILALNLALLMVCLFWVGSKATTAKESFLSKYVQVVYNTKNGIGSNEVNCLYQSTSGYIWVGTDGGLYRSDGAGFYAINLWDTERTDVYSINCITQDSEGRMWIGTGNYGLFYIQKGQNYHLQQEYYDGIKNIIDVCQTENGTIYVATDSGLFICIEDEDTDGGMKLVPYTDETVSNCKLTDVAAIGDKVWALYGTNRIYVLGEEKVEAVIDTPDITADDLRSLSCIDNEVYVGTSGSDILVCKDAKRISKINGSVDGVNRMLLDSFGRIWAVADTGFGYFDASNKFNRIWDCKVDNYLSDMIEDYEGNLWISSMRMGVLNLNRSKFVDYNLNTKMSETMVNCVFVYGSNRYIGTDDGLIIHNSKDEVVENDLTKMLAGVSIRHINKDRDGNLWISTHRKFGVIKVSLSGEISTFGRMLGLPSYAVNSTLQLSDGRIAVATEEGVAIIEKNGEIKDKYTATNGMGFSNTLSMCETDDGHLWCGTDGGGIYDIDYTNQKISVYNSEDGINSNVISVLKKGQNGIWIGTDNGLCFYNESFRPISNIDYSNSIYDLVTTEKSVWIIGSKGVLQTTEEELLGSKGISGRYFDVNDGLSKDINNVCRTIIDNSGLLYVCCNTGICTLDTTDIPYNNTAPRIKVTAIDVDGKHYEFNDLDDELKVSKNASRITIYFAVFSFSNRENISVEYSLQGFDEQPIIVKGSSTMEAVYTNLDGGEYRFILKAYNGDGKPCEEELSFAIEKEKKITENPAARYIIVILVLMGIFVAVYAVIHFRKIILNNTKEIEKLSKEHQQAVKSSSAKNDYLANMSNEIKTPINAIMAKADEILQIVDVDEQVKENVVNIYETSNNIIEKVDDIILLAKLEAGKIDVVSEKYSVTTLIYELSEFAMQLIGEKSVKFFVEIGEDVSDNVVGDAGKIKSILIRILDNAVRYTKEGSITLSVDCYEYIDKSNKSVMNYVYTVSDTGIGIQEDRLDTVFELSQADSKINKNHSGSGVGLAIAKGFADVLGAELEVDSAYGAGSTFTLSVYQTLADSSNVSHGASKVEETVSKDVASKLWLPNVNALLVDDEEVSREVALSVLVQFEMKIDVATSGICAIDMVLNNDYDVIFMDLSMPVMSGIDAMKEIRELDGDAYSYMPIVSMDNNAIDDNKDMLLEAGFTDTLIKPIDIRRVAAILKDCLPEDKIKERTNDIANYIEGSRYSDGLLNMKPYIDIEAAIEKIGGSIDVFNKLIVAYYNQNENAVSDLYDKLENDIRGFKAKIHTIKTTSINIGAYDCAKDATKLEAAINIGNKDYVKDNMEDFTDNLAMLIQMISEYIMFMNDISGMTDEEYAGRRADDKEKKENIEGISVELLEQMQQSLNEENYRFIDECIASLMDIELDGDDRGFVEALADVAARREADAIEDLIATYISLKL